MHSFLNDYAEGAHERLLEALIRTNHEQLDAYGNDTYSNEARTRIRELCAAPDAGVHFFIGGTQTNETLISAALRPHQGVLCADSGHIAVHESGAIEACGHKVLPLPAADGKVTAKTADAAFTAHEQDVNFEHMVQPAMLYISNPTELGTIYTLAELVALRKICSKHHAYLYLDGARLGCALTVPNADVTLADLARLTDAFYIGGTKLGALCGEALVITNPAIDRDFRYIQKQKGARTAKGRVVGIQFAELLRDGLYWEIASGENRLAARLSEGLTAKGYPLFAPTQTNQVFPIIPDHVLKALSQQYEYGFWESYDDTHSVVRFCISWATPESTVEGLLAALPDNRA
ncbi:MAG: aminotransferase class I/II-fold pyridoxal phosphate-dependent enzyme [Clostridiaceae bacterium]|nr:aminotransferase class I/II-fold pyridoxal phosphate-dependent enzyme [Clostridiaceae bacterium]